MSRFLKIFPAAILALSFFIPSNTALAASMKDEPFVQPTSWTGFYLGAQVGYGWANGEIDDDPGPGTSFTSVPEWDMDGVVGGVYAGYNVQFNSLVLGLEADVNISGVDGSDIVDGEELGGDIAWFGSIRGRLGFAQGSWLAFVTAGWAFADADHFQEVSGDVEGSFSGWTAGGGVEYMYTPNLIVRAEYRYYDFGDDNLIMPAPYTDRDYDLDLQTFTVGLAVKF